MPELARRNENENTINNKSNENMQIRTKPAQQNCHRVVKKPEHVHFKKLEPENVVFFS